MATTIPYPLFTVLTVLMVGMVLYSLHVTTHVQRIFSSFTAMILAFMLSQQIVSGNVVRITSLISSTDTILTEKTVIIIPELAYLLLFIGVCMTIITVAVCSKYIIYLYEESHKQQGGNTHDE